MCRMATFGCMLPVMCFYQTSPCPCQGCAYRPHSQTGLPRNFRVAHPRVPQQQNFSISGGQGAERFLYRSHPLVMLYHGVCRRLDRGLGDRIGLEQRQVPLSPNRRPGLVPRQVGGDRKHPCTRLLGAVSQRTHEHFLRQILGPFRVPHLAVEETHYRRIGGLVQLLELIHDWRSRDTGPDFRRVALEDGGPGRNCTRWSWRAHPPPSEDTARVKRVLLGGPLAAQVGLGRAAVGSTALVQRTTDAIVVEIPAGRDHLRLDGVVPSTFHLAEIR